MITIRPAVAGDQAFWFLWIPLTNGSLRQKDNGKNCLCCSCRRPASRVATLQFFLGHDSFLYHASDRRSASRQGTRETVGYLLGTTAKAAGHALCLTSTQVDEQAQHFYRKLGYQDAGGLLLTSSGFEQPMELFLVKQL